MEQNNDPDYKYTKKPKKNEELTSLIVFTLIGLTLLIIGILCYIPGILYSKDDIDSTNAAFATGWIPIFFGIFFGVAAYGTTQ